MADETKPTAVPQSSTARQYVQFKDNIEALLKDATSCPEAVAEALKKDAESIKNQQTNIIVGVLGKLRSASASRLTELKEFRKAGAIKSKELEALDAARTAFITDGDPDAGDIVALEQKLLKLGINL